MRDMAAKAKATTENHKELPLEARVIQCITNVKAPHTTQDAVDQLAAEFATASLLRTHAEKRYEAVKKAVFDELPVYIAKVRNEAAENMLKTTTTVVGSEWQIDFAANKPSVRVDIDELRTALIKEGINIVTIDRCINTVSKKSTPALTLSAKLAMV
jgi:hypothetical protein